MTEAEVIVGSIPAIPFISLTAWVLLTERIWCRLPRYLLILIGWIVNLLFSVLASLGTLVLVVATFVVFEVTAHPSSVQRTQVANVVWAMAGVAVIAIWVWYFRAKGKAR